MTRTARSSAMVTTSSARAGWLAAVMRSLLRRTLPALTSAAAAVRVRTTRACHSHLSMRWRSVSSAFLQLLLQRGEFGEGRIRIGLPAPLLGVDPLARFTAVAILEVAAALAARAVTALAAVAVGTLAATTLALLRTRFPLWTIALRAVAPLARSILRFGPGFRGS